MSRAPDIIQEIADSGEAVPVVARRRQTAQLDVQRVRIVGVGDGLMVGISEIDVGTVSRIAWTQSSALAIGVENRHRSAPVAKSQPDA
jgi:hypothetical protein